MKWLYPASATVTSHIGSTMPKALIQVGSTYYYGVISAGTFKIYKATSLLVGDETLLGTLTSTLANPNPACIHLYCYNQAVVYVVAAFTDYVVAAGVNDVQYFSAKYTIATSTWAAIGNATINSGIALVETRVAFILGQWVTAAGNHYLLTQHHRKAGGNTYYRTTCYSSSFGASSTMDGAAGQYATGSGGYWNETAAKYYWLYCEAGGVGWVFKYATTVPTINNDDPSIAEPTLNVAVMPWPDMINYAGMSNGSRLIVSVKNYAYYDVNVASWNVEDFAGSSYGIIGYLDNEPYYVYIDTNLYFRLGNTWMRIWNSFTAAHDKKGAAGYIAVIQDGVQELSIRADLSIRTAPVSQKLFETPKLAFDVTPAFVTFDRQVMLVYNDSDEWCGAYYLQAEITSGGYKHITGMHLMEFDLNKIITDAITASTADEHLSALIASHCELMTEGSLAAYATDYDLVYKTPLRLIAFLLSVLEKAVVFWSMEGEISMDDGTQDWGDNLLFGTQPIISVIQDQSFRKPRYIRVRGGYVDGSQLESYFPMYNDGPAVDLVFSNITDQTILDLIAENIAVLMDVDAIMYRVRFKGATLLQPGTQIDFSYSPLSIAEAKYFVLAVSYDLYSNINEVLLSTHLIYPQLQTLASDLEHYTSVIQDAINNPSGAGITPKQIQLSNADATIVEFDSDVNLAGGNTKVPTDLAVKTYADAITTAFQAADTTLTAALNAACMIGSANAAWIPCLYVANSATTYQMYHSGGLANVGATDFTMIFHCPLPTNRGGKKLYIKGMKVVLQDADAGDYVDIMTLYGEASGGATNKSSWAGNGDGVGTYPADPSFAAIDMSSYDMASVYLALVCTNALDLGVVAVELHCYYDT